jgi:hypothetical protein
LAIAPPVAGTVPVEVGPTGVAVGEPPLPFPFPFPLVLLPPVVVLFPPVTMPVPFPAEPVEIGPTPVPIGVVTVEIVVALLLFVTGVEVGPVEVVVLAIGLQPAEAGSGYVPLLP